MNQFASRIHRPGGLLSAFLLALVAALPLTAQEAGPRPVFENGLAQDVRAFRTDLIREQLWVEASFDSDGDGAKDRMFVTVARPQATETNGLRLPVIYETSPYYRGIAGSAEGFWDPHHELGAEPPERAELPWIEFQDSLPTTLSRAYERRWLERGFAIVHSCSPGTGLSQGCVTVGGSNESLAPKAVIDWLNGRAKGYTTIDGDEEVVADWCTGKVGMIGTSYNGTLPLAAATTGVEGLEAIVPVAPNTSYYHYYRSHGLVRHPGGYMGEDIDVLYDFVNSGFPGRREWCDCKVRDEELLANLDRITGDYSEWWAQRDYLNHVDGVKAATLMCHAFNDWNVMPEHSVRIYRALRERGVPAMAYFHQGGHGGMPPDELLNRWFTRHLHGVENGVEELPKAWIRRGYGRRGPIVKYADYPNPKAEDVTLHPVSKGRAIGGLALEKPDSPGREEIVDDARIPAAEFAEASSSEHRLLYASPELKEPLHLSGTSRLRVRLAASKPAANFSVWVVMLPWNMGDAEEPKRGKPVRRKKDERSLITRGWADPQNHTSIEESEPLVPGTFYDLEFDLQPDDQVIPAGRRIGLMLFSSDHDFTLRPKAGTRLFIDLEGTRITMPVVGGEAAWRKATGS